jgi:hypothetical protein
MEYAYQSLLNEYKLNVSDLSEDAQIGIQNIQSIDRMIKLAERKGTKVRTDVIKKLKANDKWVCREILDQIEETNKNTDEMPFEKEEIENEIKEAEIDPVGVEIEKELETLMKEGVTELDIETLKSKAPRSYKVIFDNYESEQDNGVETSSYKLIETDLEVFTLTKN